MSEYNIENLAKKKGGKTAEDNNTGLFEAGVWEHPEAKNPDGTPIQIITLYDPLFRNVQSEAVARFGYVRVRDVKEGDVVLLSAQYDKIKNGTDSNEGLKGIQARLSALEAENAQLRAQNDAKETEKPEADESKPLKTQNSSELAATAEAEGVDLSGADTNKLKVEAIQKSRDEKEGK